jgi:hypothetical protein
MEPVGESGMDFKAPVVQDVKPEIAVSKEPEGSLGKFTAYVDMRMAEGVTAGSRLYRDRFPMQPDAYKAEVIKSFQEVSSVLGLEQTFFDDPINLEIMVAISDSWSLNALLNIEDANKFKTERDFLFSTARILAGNKSKYNIDAAGKAEEGAGKFVEIEKTSEGEKRVQDFKRYRENMDNEKTEILQSKILEHGEGSLLADVREKLGITELTEQVPFRVVVLDVYRFDRTKQGLKPHWNDIVEDGDDTQAFVSYDPVDGVPTMFIAAEDFDKLDDKDELNKRHIKQVIGHEYAHTQRMMRMGNDTQLGRIFDERMVTFASGGSNHADTTMILGTMDRLLPDGEKTLRDLIADCAKSSDNIPGFLKFISDKFGLRSTLLLLATQPKNYTEPNGITQIPEVRNDPELRMSDLIGVVINERQAIDPRSIDRFTHRMRNKTPDELEMERFMLNYARVQLPEVLQVALNER